MSIAPNGGTKSFTLSKGKYVVRIEDDDAQWYKDYGYYYTMESLQFSLEPGMTKTVIYNSDKNEDNLIVQ
ncbi:hypothetical protein FACS1894172_20920 [Spirochaetia bacterium]|nr:hypothetical protein FACS1894164_20590 [Spirochaetia bacterium]GHU37488.1 hypothetical protein FACS1894172_20920 [Spirochaetia bacterium]